MKKITLSSLVHEGHVFSGAKAQKNYMQTLMGTQINYGVASIKKLAVIFLTNPKKTKMLELKIKVTLFCLFFITVTSCKKAVIFEEAQPQNVKEINSFPRKYIGTYYNLEDKSEITITKYFIFEKMISKDTINIKELHKNEIIKNDSLFNTKSKEKYKIKKINDSLLTNYVFSDTTFRIGKNNILKKFKGNLFLNKLEEKSGFWSVEKLNLSKGVIKISSIETKTEIELLKSITETKTDTIKPFKVKPTKKQFKEFINKNGFLEGKIYLKK